MTTISVRVLDCTVGRPAPGVLLRLDRRDDRRWEPVVSGVTVNDGRLPAMEEHQVRCGPHQLTIGPSGYFAGLGTLVDYRDFAVGIQVGETEADLHLAVYVSAAGFAIYWERT